MRGQRDSAQAAVDRFVHLTGDHKGMEHIELGIPILLGTDAEAAAALKTAGLSAHILDQYNGTFNLRHDHPDRDAATDALMGELMRTNRAAFQAYYAGAGGALRKGAAAIANPGVSPLDHELYALFIYDMWDVMPTAEQLQASACPATSTLCTIFLGRALAKAGRWPEHQRLVALVRTAAETSKDTAQARLGNRNAEIIRAIGLREHGDLEGARAILTKYAVERGAGDHARYELALIDAQTKHYADALRNFSSVRTTFQRPAALYGMAAMYEQLGQPKEARDYYMRFLAYASKGDALPRIASARAAVARLQPKD
jgi:tetratricopeptide (TPR) repeat protein